MSFSVQQRQAEGKTAALARLTLQHDLAPVQVRQLLRNGQTEASGAMPQPVSVTFTQACPFSAAHTTVTRPPEGV